MISFILSAYPLYLSTCDTTSVTCLATLWTFAVASGAAFDMTLEYFSIVSLTVLERSEIWVNLEERSP